MFFDQMFGGAGTGQGGGASAFTSPGMSPQSMALLMAMQNANKPGMVPGLATQPAAPGPAFPATPPPPNMGGPPQIKEGAIQMPQNNMLQQLLQMDPNKLKSILQGLGIGNLGGGFGPGSAQQVYPSMDAVGPFMSEMGGGGMFTGGLY